MKSLTQKTKNWFNNVVTRRFGKYSFQNEYMKSSFLPKYEPKTGTVPHYKAEILTIFGSYFGRNNDFINSF